MKFLLERFWPYLAGAVLLLAFGAGWHFGSGRWETKYQTLQAENWEGQAKAERAARAALQSQLETAHATITHNTGVINALDQKNAATLDELARNRAALERLRATQARSPAGSRPVPEADRGRGSTETSQAAELRECQSVLIDLTAESEMNADQLDSLSVEITPQL